MLRREKLAAGFTGIGGVVGNEKLISITKQVNLAAVEIPKFQPRNAFQNSGQAGIFILHRIAKAIAGCVKIGKQALDIPLRGVTTG